MAFVGRYFGEESIWGMEDWGMVMMGRVVDIGVFGVFVGVCFSLFICSGMFLGGSVFRRVWGLVREKL